MKVLLYSEFYDAIKKSGVGKAITHQMKALELNGVETTLDLKEPHDLVHINTIGLKSYRLAKRSRKAGIPVVYHGHSTKEDFRNSFIGTNLAAPLFGKWITRCYKTGTVVVTPTPYSKRLIESYGVKRPIFPVSNGVDLDFFARNEAGAAAFRQQYGFGPDDKVIVAVGLYIDRKGIVDFVELARRLPQYRFIWFGYNPLWQVPPHVGRAVRTKLPNLQFPGYVDSDHLRHAYWGSDLFLFPTHEETEGIVLLEAMAAGCPALIRDIPIYTDWLKEGETVYKAADVDGFERAIPEILEGRRPDLTAAAYRVVAERSLTVIGSQLKEIYTRCLNHEFDK